MNKLPPSGSSPQWLLQGATLRERERERERKWAPKSERMSRDDASKKAFALISEDIDWQTQKETWTLIRAQQGGEGGGGRTGVASGVGGFPRFLKSLRVQLKQSQVHVCQPAVEARQVGRHHGRDHLRHRAGRAAADDASKEAGMHCARVSAYDLCIRFPQFIPLFH